MKKLLHRSRAALLDIGATKRDDWRSHRSGAANARAGHNDRFVDPVSRSRLRRIAVSRAQHPRAFHQFNGQACAGKEAGKGGVGREAPADTVAASAFEQARSRDDLAAGNVRIFAKCVAKALGLDIVCQLARLRARAGCIECGRRYARSQNGREKFHRHSSLPCGRFWPSEGKK